MSYPPIIVVLAATILFTRWSIKSSERAWTENPAEATTLGKKLSFVGLFLALLAAAVLWNTGHAFIGIFRVIVVVFDSEQDLAKLSAIHSSYYSLYGVAGLIAISTILWMPGAARVVRGAQHSLTRTSLLLSGGLALTIGGGLIAYSGVQAIRAFHRFATSEQILAADVEQVISGGNPLFLLGCACLVLGNILLLLSTSKLSIVGIREQQGHKQAPKSGWLWMSLMLTGFSTFNLAWLVSLIGSSGIAAARYVMESTPPLDAGILSGIMVRFLIAWVLLGVAFIGWGIGQLVMLLPKPLGAVSGQIHSQETMTTSPPESGP